MVTILDANPTNALTTVARVRQSLGLTDADPARDEWLAALVERASAAIVHFLQYRPFRDEVEERATGSDRTELMLTRTPLVRVASVVNDLTGEMSASNYRISDADAGLLWARYGWGDDRPYTVGLGIFPQPLPQLGDQPWVVRYTAGDLSAAENVPASGYAALGSSGVLRAPEGAPAFPNVASGELVRLQGWRTSYRNRTYRVLAREADAIWLAGLTGADETGEAGAEVIVAMSPKMATLEQLAIVAVSAWYFGGPRDPSVQSERIGDWAATYKDTGGSAGENRRQIGILPSTVEATLIMMRREA